MKLISEWNEQTASCVRDAVRVNSNEKEKVSRTFMHELSEKMWAACLLKALMSSDYESMLKDKLFCGELGSFPGVAQPLRMLDCDISKNAWMFFFD